MQTLQHSQPFEQRFDPTTEAGRLAIAKMIMRLFEHWQLSQDLQLNLLGLSPNSRAVLSQYRQGKKAIPNSHDLLDRVGWLFSIHTALRLLYPYDETLRYQWVHQRNRDLDNLKPIDVMAEQGMLGIAKIARYLDFKRGQ